MDLLSGYNSSDEENSSDTSENESLESPSTGEKTKSVLPSPDEVLNKSSKTSVFQNQYNSEADSLKILEKHVKMVENKKNITEVDGRKVCWMYRQGRCRFGRRCKMFHDSELRDSLLTNAASNQSEEIFAINDFPNAAVSSGVSVKPITASKKKHYGVTDTLEPPKKALKQIERIKANEIRQSHN